MRTALLLPAALAALLISLPMSGQAAHEHGTPAAPTAPGSPGALAPDPDKAYLLKQEFTARTAELQGRIKARQADLEILLATKPGDEAAVRKLAADISTLRGQLFEQTTLLRQRYAKETGTPLRQTLHLDDGQEEGGMACKMMGKGMMSGNGDMNHSGMNHGPAADKIGSGDAPAAKL